MQLFENCAGVLLNTFEIEAICRKMRILLQKFGNKVDSEHFFSACCELAEKNEQRFLLFMRERIEKHSGGAVLDAVEKHVLSGVGENKTAAFTLFAEGAEAVRYAYTTWTEANVYQKNGIPLKPFEVKIG